MYDSCQHSAPPPPLCFRGGFNTAGHRLRTSRLASELPCLQGKEGHGH